MSVLVHVSFSHRKGRRILLPSYQVLQGGEWLKFVWRGNYSFHQRRELSLEMEFEVFLFVENT